MDRIRISNETLNCYGTWIVTEGIELEQFRRNPVLLWMHRRGVVIGRVEDIRVENGEVTGTPVFDEVREESKLAKQQWDKGTLRMGSPNFEIIETSEDAALMKPGQTMPTITRSKLIEFSIVDIGGNDDNIRLSYGAELNVGDQIPLTKPNNTINQTKNETKMNELKTIALMLGLADTASLVEVQQQVKGLLELKKDHDTLKTQHQELQTKLEQMQLAGVTQLVDQAVADGKLDAANKAHFIELGKQVGAESLKLTLDAMHGAVRPSAILSRGGGAEPQKKTGQWEKLSEVPQAELKLMRTEDPEQYRRLYRAEFGVECPEKLE